MNNKLTKIKATTLGILILTISACNGGNVGASSGGGGTNPVPTPLPAPNNPSLAVQVSANSGSSSSLCSNYNTPCVSVTICNPTSPTQCTTVNNILIDSGSYGLRVFSSTLGSVGSSLPIETQGSNQIAECVSYGDGTANWGPVAMANITLAGASTTESVAMQLINASYPGASNCSGAANSATPSDFGINGILGVGPLTDDSRSGNYYACNSSTCGTNTITPPQYVANPIAFLGNGLESGITFQLPAIGSGGASNVTGYAIFGVGSNSDNTPGSGVNIYPIYVGPNFPTVISTSSPSISNSIAYGFLDTGSNGIYFNSSSINQCGDWYCPSNTLTISANNTSTNGQIGTSFNIAYPSNGNSAFNNLGGYFGNTDDVYLDYGLPFFFGKTVYICFNGMTCNGVAGPYWAF